MGLLTSKQRQKISDVIKDQHLAFMAEVLGPDSIPEADYKRLKEAGKLKGGSAVVQDAATAAAVLGAMSVHADPIAMKPGAAWSAVTMDLLAPVEKESVALSKTKIGEYIKGLGNKIDDKTGHLLVDADHKLHKKKLTQIQDTVARGIEDKKTAAQIATDLAKVTKDVEKNWAVIAQTEVHNVMEDAKAAVIASNVPAGTDPLVFKRPRPDACPFCVLLYTIDGKVPRIFRLSELVGNGTNHGRKARKPTLKGAAATEWKPVLGAMHPWCACTLQQMPSGFAFDKDGQLIYVGLKKAERLTVEHLDKALLNHKCT